MTGLPPNVTFGWTATTGLADDIHEITDVDVKTLYPAADLFSDAFTGATTTAPVFGLPPGAGFPCLTAGTDPSATPVPGCAVAGFTTTFAQSVPNVTVPAAGSASVTLGNIEIDENSTGVLTAPIRIQITLPAGLTFAGSPFVSTLVSNGLRVGGAALELCSPGCRRFAFDVTQPSTAGSARILISGLSAAVPSGFVESGQIVPVRVDIAQGESSGGGLTPVSGLQVATFAAPPNGPVLTSTSLDAVAEGVTTTIVLFGEKLNLLDFSPGHDTIDFGSGISIVPGSIVVSPDGKKITLKIKVDPGAALGLRNVTITDNPSGQQLTLADEFIVNPPPTVTSAGVDTGGEGLSPLLSPPTGDVLRSQTLIINGSGFQAPTTVPSNLIVSVSGTGITVNSVGFAGANRLAVNVDVAKGAQTVPQRTVTVINPDLGSVTSGPVLSIALGPADAPVGLAPTSTTGTATPPPGPTVTSITTTPRAIPRQCRQR